MQKFIAVGNLTKDPELRTTTSGKSVAGFSIAVNDGYSKDADGNPVVDFFNCNAWGKQGENIAKYCKKGSKILICGTIHQRSYEAQDGTKRYTTEVTVNESQFLSSKGANDGESSIDASKLPDTPDVMQPIPDDGLPF
jgi:single-strand DNA-binding protein